MPTLPTDKKHVNQVNPTTNVPRGDPVAAFGKWMQSMGIGKQVADAAQAWIERFRAFRALPTTARPMAEAIQQFKAHLHSSLGASVPAVTEAAKTIERFLAWWRQQNAAARPVQPSIRPCKHGVSPQERNPSLPLEEPVGLLGRVRREIRVRHYSYRTEQTYLHWIERYLRFIPGQEVVACVGTKFRGILE